MRFLNFGAARRRSPRRVRGNRLLSMPRLEALEERMLLALSDGTALGQFVADNFPLTDANQDARWIGRLYVDLLGRPGQGSEISSWLDVSRGFLASAEFQGLLVNDPIDVHVFAGWYQNYLDRDADSAGLVFWLASLASGSTWEQVQQGFLLSEEYSL